MKKNLEDLRKEIDAPDEELIMLLAKRFAIVREIGKVKKIQEKQPLDEKRWQEVVAKITAKAKKQEVPEELIKKIYNEIHNAALDLQK